MTASLLTGTATGALIGNDSLIGIEGFSMGSGSDNLTGDANANRFITRAGNDTVVGGAGDDTINGGIGNDALTGDTGADMFGYLRRPKAATRSPTSSKAETRTRSTWRVSTRAS